MRRCSSRSSSGLPDDSCADRQRQLGRRGAHVEVDAGRRPGRRGRANPSRPSVSRVDRVHVRRRPSIHTSGPAPGRSGSGPRASTSPGSSGSGRRRAATGRPAPTSSATSIACSRAADHRHRVPFRAERDVGEHVERPSSTAGATAAATGATGRCPRRRRPARSRRAAPRPISPPSSASMPSTAAGLIVWASSGGARRRRRPRDRPRARPRCRAPRPAARRRRARRS